MKKILTGIFTAVLFGHCSFSSTLWAQENVDDPFEYAEPATEIESPFDSDDQSSSEATSPFEQSTTSPDSPFSSSSNESSDSPFAATNTESAKSPFEQDSSSGSTSPFEQETSSDVTSPFEQDSSSDVTSPFEQAPPSAPDSPFEQDTSSSTTSPFEQETSSDVTSPFEQTSPSAPDSPFEQDTSSGTTSPFEQETSSDVTSPFEQDSSGDVTSPFEQAPSTAPDSPFEQQDSPSGPTSPFERETSTDVTSPFEQQDSSSDVTSPFETTPDDGVATSPFENLENQLDAVVDPFQEGEEQEPLLQRSKKDSVNIRGLYVLADQEGLQSVEEIHQLGTDITNGELNTIYIETKTAGGTTYLSDYTPALPFVAPGFDSPIIDLKSQIPSDCRIIAVVDLLPSYSATISGFPPDDHPLGQNPDMICYSLKGDRIAVGNAIYMDPGNPQVQGYLENLVREIEEKVAPDGYLFRGLRYPGANWGYSPKAVKSFRDTVGGEGPPPPDHPIWCAWRRQQITNLLSDLSEIIKNINNDSIIGVEIDTKAYPPTTWRQWTTSTTYAENMQDWISWCQDDLIDQIVFNVFERNKPQGNTLSSWVQFINSNTYSAQAIIAMNGSLNFTRGFTRQMATVRNRGTGVIIYHYADPIRNQSRGFYQGLPNLVFRNAPGHAIPGKVIRGTRESRIFTTMSNPPVAVLLPTPTPLGYEVVRESDLLNFATPTPIPTPTPPPSFKPAEVTRKIKLKSGMEVEAEVLEVTPGTITLQPLNGSPMVISRSVIETITPPLE